MTPGARNLITDVPGILVGNASDATLKSGVTVVTSDGPMMAAAHVMGGAPGTRETDLLAPDKLIEGVDAIVLSGGSAFGLEAASGVANGLRAQGRGYTVGPATVPIVPAAILFDLLNGGTHDWDENPYPALGRQALDAAARDFSIGSAGAGTGATAARYKGGLGSASYVMASGVTVGALVAANPLGAVTTPGGAHFWAASFEEADEFGGRGVDQRTGLASAAQATKMSAQNTNTTLAIVATDAKLTKAQAQRVAIAAHDGMARAIVPSHTPFDGDIVFALSSGLGAPTDTPDDVLRIGNVAAMALTRAIARAIYAATPADDDILPTWQSEN